jgi:hypothetical protein
MIPVSFRNIKLIIFFVVGRAVAVVDTLGASASLLERVVTIEV